MPDPMRLVVSRRRLLLAGAGGLFLVACGGEGEDERSAADDEGDDQRELEDDETTTTSELSGGEAGLVLFRVFSPQQPVGPEVRLPLGLADGEGVPLSSPPRSITVRRRPPDADAFEQPVTLQRHGDGIPRPYYPYRTTFDAVGTWLLQVEADGTTLETAVDAVPAAEAPAVPGPGEEMLAIATPTIERPLGVDPVCTRDPVCPLHAVSLDDALEGDRAVAFLISTPAFCQTAICGPVLDLLVERQERYADRITMIHAEVYTDDTARQTTAAVNAFGLAWEPSLFLAGPDGTIRTRLDYTFDASELDEALEALLA